MGCIKKRTKSHETTVCVSMLRAGLANRYLIRRHKHRQAGLLAVIVCAACLTTVWLSRVTDALAI